MDLGFRIVPNQVRRPKRDSIAKPCRCINYPLRQRVTKGPQSIGIVEADRIPPAIGIYIEN